MYKYLYNSNRTFDLQCILFKLSYHSHVWSYKGQIHSVFSPYSYISLLTVKTIVLILKSVIIDKHTANVHYIIFIMFVYTLLAYLCNAAQRRQAPLATKPYPH